MPDLDVPLAQASASGDQVQVPYDKQLVKDAPGVEADGHLSEAEEQQLWRHYGLDYGAGDATSGPETDRAMTRSEEELRVGTETRERGRARLRKYVTTEQVTTTVPVQREQVRLEREPVTDADLDAATSGPDIAEAEHEVVLREEEPVVEKRVVPRERVRLETDTVTDERQVTGEVRKEQLDLDDQRRKRRRR